MREGKLGIANDFVNTAESNEPKEGSTQLQDEREQIIDDNQIDSGRQEPLENNIETNEGDNTPSGNEPEQEIDESLRVDLTSLAEAYKRRGEISEDFEISDDLTEDNLIKALKDKQLEPLRGEVKQELEKEYQKYGITQEYLQRKKYESVGVDFNKVSQIDDLNTLINASVDPSDEKYKGFVNILGKEYYIRRGFSEEESDRYAANDMKDFKPKELEGKYKEFFKETKESHEAEVKDAFQKYEEKVESEQREAQELLTNAFETRKVGNKTYTQQEITLINDFLNKKDQVIEDESGNPVRVTGYEKMQYEQSQNPQRAIQTLFDSILVYNNKAVKNNSEFSNRKKIVGELRIAKGGKNNNNPRTSEGRGSRL